MEENISSDQVLGYLKGKYLSKPTNNTTDISNDKSESKVPTGDESEFDGDTAENMFLLSKLSKVQVELTKWLDILKQKINN